MTVMACDNCDRVFVIARDSKLLPCPRCFGQTRWATRQEVCEHLRRPVKKCACDDLNVPLPGVDEKLRVRSMVVCEAAKEVCEETRETRERSRRMREARKR